MPVKVIQIKSIDVLKNDEKKLETSHQAKDAHLHMKQKIQHAQEELQQLQVKKEQLLEQTNAEIREQKKLWEEEKQTYIEQAQQEGYEDGFSQGKEESIKQYDHLIQKVNEIVELATKDYHKTIKQSDQTIIDLAIHTAEKVIHQHLQDQPETFTQIVQDAIDDLTDQAHIHIFIHASHYDHLIQQKDELKQLIGNDTKLSIYVDSTATQDSCIIEYPAGKIDASIDTQLTEIRSVLLKIATEKN